MAQNVNKLYTNLLSTIEHLEQEKETVRDMERSKTDFLRAASHELKTPVTALNATLENMILSVGKYRDYDLYLPKCKEIVDSLSKMIHEILEISKLNAYDKTETVDVSEVIEELCEPYQMIAAAHQISFSIDLPEKIFLNVSVDQFKSLFSLWRSTGFARIFAPDNGNFSPTYCMYFKKNCLSTARKDGCRRCFGRY